MTFVSATSPTLPPHKSQDAVRVLVVDDSAVIRGMTTRLLETDPAIRVIASAADGKMAVNIATRDKPDVIVLDIEMPVMDGLTALPHLLSACPDVRIIMSSTLTQKGAEITMRALRNGAADYIAKPTSTREIGNADSFRHELLEKVKALGQAGQRKSSSAQPQNFTPTRVLTPSGKESVPTETARTQSSAPSIYANAARGNLNLRAMPTRAPSIIAIGSSTGGPQALFTVIAAIGKNLRQPIVLTQHMPAGFTAILADHIAKHTGVPCVEATDGMILEAGRVHVAPGDYHMTVIAKDGRHIIALNQGASENYCRPAVDPMLRSLIPLFGSGILTVILTGMGSDGCKGSQMVTAAGGTILAQDEPTSVVWGMPGSVASAGLCSAVLPVHEIGATVRRLAMK